MTCPLLDAGQIASQALAEVGPCSETGGKRSLETLAGEPPELWSQVGAFYTICAPKIKHAPRYALSIITLRYNLLSLFSGKIQSFHFHSPEE